MFIERVAAFILLSSLACLSGCATTGPAGKAEIDTWTGATVDELYLAYGTPSRLIEQGDGSTIVEFQHSRLDSSTPYYCTVRYEVDPAGFIVGGSAEGNIGGCNRLIKAYQASP